MVIDIFQNKLIKKVDVNQFDQELIMFSTLPFTSSVSYIVSVKDQSPGQNKSETMAKIIHLIDKIRSTYPPANQTDISGIEEIYS